MAAVSRVGDQNQAGGAIKRGADSVFVNGVAIGLHVSGITPHAPWDRRSHSPHEAATTTEGSATVFAEGVPVLRVGSGNTCGHSIVQGSPDVFVP